MSKEASTAHRKALFNRLPWELRDELITLGRRAKNIFGRIRFQDIFDQNLHLFERLAANGATAVDIGEVLAAAGVTRRDGTILPDGTLTSALSRARERAGRRTATSAGPACPCRALHRPAMPYRTRKKPARLAACPDLFPFNNRRLPYPASVLFGLNRTDRQVSSCRHTPAAPRHC
ncbi:hypothetical protein [Bradyrhizobium sp.]|jgi:hypothetical protein|uniref:hypothetical protein n=1 Tax=Bradyrhizobium sp. TaxID=376 RepID=UPI002DDD0277|nr:hypothetical protein [Bradyrhizobium sp.]HEV2153960.1 hypothetical protein [Bradyrhizobium sp.]